MSVEAETRAGRARQDAADQAVAGTARRCGETRTHGSSTFVCVRPPHAGNQHTNTWRRKRGEPVNADHHVFVKPSAEAQR